MIFYTNTNVFVNSAYVDKIFFASYEDQVKISDETSRAIVLNNLGYSVTDNLVSDLIILTEGPTDVPVIEEFLVKMDLLSKYNIKFWPLGGDIMSKVDLSVFSGYKIVALIDSDPGSDTIRQKFISKCNELKIPVHKLKRYSIENYFSVNALRKVFKGQISDDLQEIAPDKKLQEQIGIDVKGNNRRIAKLMDLQDIKETDLGEFFELIKKKLNE